MLAIMRRVYDTFVADNGCPPLSLNFPRFLQCLTCPVEAVVFNARQLFAHLPSCIEDLLPRHVFLCYLSCSATRIPGRIGRSRLTCRASTVYKAEILQVQGACQSGVGVIWYLQPLSACWISGPAKLFYWSCFVASMIFKLSINTP